MVIRITDFDMLNCGLVGKSSIDDTKAQVISLSEDFILVNNKLSLVKTSEFSLKTHTHDGLMRNTERAKLEGIELGSTKNKKDSFLLDRNNHYGSIKINDLLISEIGVIGNLGNGPEIVSISKLHDIPEFNENNKGLVPKSIGEKRLLQSDGQWVDKITIDEVIVTKDIISNNFSGISHGINTGDQLVSLKGAAIGEGYNEIEVTIPDNSISLQSLKSISSGMLGRIDGIGQPDLITFEQLRKLLSLSGNNSGDQLISLRGLVKGDGYGIINTTIDDNSIPPVTINIPIGTLIGNLNNTNTVSIDDLINYLPKFDENNIGILTHGPENKYLRGDGKWSSIKHPQLSWSDINGNFESFIQQYISSYVKNYDNANFNDMSCENISSRTASFVSIKVNDKDVLTSDMASQYAGSVIELNSLSPNLFVVGNTIYGTGNATSLAEYNYGAISFRITKLNFDFGFDDFIINCDENGNLYYKTLITSCKTNDQISFINDGNTFCLQINGKVITSFKATGKISKAYFFLRNSELRNIHYRPIYNEPDPKRLISNSVTWHTNGIVEPNGVSKSIGNIIYQSPPYPVLQNVDYVLRFDVSSIGEGYVSCRVNYINDHDISIGSNVIWNKISPNDTVFCEIKTPDNTKNIELTFMGNDKIDNITINDIDISRKAPFYPIGEYAPEPLSSKGSNLIINSDFRYGTMGLSINSDCIKKGSINDPCFSYIENDGVVWFNNTHVNLYPVMTERYQWSCLGTGNLTITIGCYNNGNLLGNIIESYSSIEWQRHYKSIHLIPTTKEISVSVLMTIGSKLAGPYLSPEYDFPIKTSKISLGDFTIKSENNALMFNSTMILSDKLYINNIETSKLSSAGNYIDITNGIINFNNGVKILDKNGITIKKDQPLIISGETSIVNDDDILLISGKSVNINKLEITADDVKFKGTSILPKLRINGFIPGVPNNNSTIWGQIVPFNVSLNYEKCVIKSTHIASSKTEFLLKRNNQIIGKFVFNKNASQADVSFSQNVLKEGELLTIDSGVSSNGIKNITILLR